MTTASEWVPNTEDVRLLDEEMAQKGVPVRRRPELAVGHWMRLGKPMPTDFVVAAKGLRQAFEALHPSVDFSNQPFAVLAASARSVAYEVNPPIVFGSMPVSPIQSVKITQAELQRIHQADPTAFWELYYQAADAIDLFHSEMDFHPQEPEAAKMLSVGFSQLQASARQMIGSSTDGSLEQAMALAAELVVKAVLREKGVPLARLQALGHSVPKLVAELATLLPGPLDAELAQVAATLPPYVASRYSPSDLGPAEAQDVYRRALFVCGEALRRTRHDQLYSKLVADPGVPPRKW